MKKFFLIASIFISTWACGQSDSLLRTDGIYIFDNGRDTVAPLDEVNTSPSSRRFMVSHLNNDPCQEGKGKRLQIGSGVLSVDSDSSIFLTALMFTSDSTGRSFLIGACREEDKVRKKVLRNLTLMGTNSSQNSESSAILLELSVLPDSTICFRDSVRTFILESFTGKAYGDSIVVTLERKLPLFAPSFEERRRYIFVSYEDIFDCTWMYLKPDTFNGKR